MVRRAAVRWRHSSDRPDCRTSRNARLRNLDVAALSLVDRVIAGFDAAALLKSPWRIRSDARWFIRKPSQIASAVGRIRIRYSGWAVLVELNASQRLPDLRSVRLPIGGNLRLGPDRVQAARLVMLTALTATPVSLEFAAFSMSRIWLSRSCASVCPRTFAHSRNAPYRAIS